ncbi:DNA replication protein [Legionella massiliensis]|uniref:DNA replication protein n=1 Tax=Legionella massiliensis TaxID=1034943 RepID=A0A078KVX0_9GAMM|nr:cell division protein ZapE [Legionella massiliensis]CDZ75904.1 DNA replication protein [Legionella massiliensis]CEE11642.1 AFG1-like ATPase [Legionella massiliensis]
MTLVEAYEDAIAKGDIRDDSTQRNVLTSMHRLMSELKQPQSSWLSWLRKPQVTGIYLYGPVGVGKTYLMDLFYQHADEPKKARFHFHHFMQQIDAQLRQRQGQKDPLRKIATDLGKSIRLLCFDEFLVHDVAYAMILSELLQALFANGIVLVATSNTRPDDLYLNGVHRKRFLPVINLINTRCEVINLTHQKDYRLGRELLIQTYLYPLDEKTDKTLAGQFASLTQEVYEQGTLLVQNREIPFIKCGEQVVWFDFKVICNLPRSQLDYLEIADRFDTVFISNIPALSSKDTIFAIMLVHLVDVLYDRGIKLIISAAVPLEQLYLEGEMVNEFKRTLSRLQEMQAADYLKRHPWRHEQNLPMFL